MDNIDQNNQNHTYNEHPGTSSQTVVDARSADSQEVPPKQLKHVVLTLHGKIMRKYG